MADKGKKRSLALIPCFNEEMTIASMVMKSKKYVDDVLVINDGSSDETASFAKNAGALVLTHDKNLGKTQAIKSGFHYALDHGYEYVITIDGDGQHNPKEIPFLLKDLQQNNYDVTIGFRYGELTEMPWWRKIGKRVLDYATSLGHAGGVMDSQSGFRGFNRKALQAITPALNGKSFSVESEQLIRSHDAGLKMGKTRVSCKYTNLNTSTKNSVSHGLSVLSYVIWLIAEKRPLYFITIPGFLMVMFGFILGIFTFQIYNRTHVFPIPLAILVSIFAIIGVLAMFMGLVLHVLPSIIKRSRGE
jgi:glycosyltransferase involved in cell wall biosynthesis